MKIFKRILSISALGMMLQFLTCCSKHDEVPPKTGRMDIDYLLPPAPELNENEREIIEIQRKELAEAIKKRQK